MKTVKEVRGVLRLSASRVPVALLEASRASILAQTGVRSEDAAEIERQKTTDEWAESNARQFVKDVDAHVEMMTDLDEENRYVLRRLITISLRQLFRDKGLTP